MIQPTDSPASDGVRADLHTHTTASDGTLSPRALVARAAERGLTHLAVTDHDTVAGLGEAAAAASEAGLELIPGVELTCEARGATVHLLGLGVAPDCGRLEAFMVRTQEMRRIRYERMVEHLRTRCGLSDVTLERVAPPSEASAARPQLARALVVLGHVNSMQAAFDRWLGKGRPAFVAHHPLPIHEAMAAVREAGGVSVLAHCGKYDSGVALARDLLDDGMDGCEVGHPDHGDRVRRRLREMAGRRGALMTSGSDFHSPGGPKSHWMGKLYTDGACLSQLLARCPAMGGSARQHN